MHSQTIDGELLASFFERLRRQRFRVGLRCIYCGFGRVHLHGRFRHRRRYRCMQCRRTFSDLTGTPLSYAKDPLLWDAYAASVDDGLTLREAASRLGVSVSTVFRWRHAMLGAVEACDDARLRGRIELAYLWFAHSEKGRRDLDRPPRKRGVACRLRFAGPTVRVIAAADRGGDINTTLVAGIITSFRQLIEALAHRIDGHATIHAATGRLSPAGMFAVKIGAVFGQARFGIGCNEDPEAHICTVTDYAARLKEWLKRFRGVATKYLPHYLAWHRLKDRLSPEARLRDPEWPMWVRC